MLPRETVKCDATCPTCGLYWTREGSEDCPRCDTCSRLTIEQLRAEVQREREFYQGAAQDRERLKAALERSISDTARLDALESLNANCRLLTHISGSERRVVTVLTDEPTPRGEDFVSLRAAADYALREESVSHNSKPEKLSVESPEIQGDAK